MQSFSSFTSAKKFKYNPISTAYWLKPDGEMTEPTSRHIGAVIKDPVAFGETEESMNKTYADHGEQKSETVEGKAREEVMMRVLKRGFVRVREIKRNWVIQVWETNKSTKDVIHNWATQVTKREPKQTYAEVTIMNTSKNSRQKITVGDIAMIGAGIVEHKIIE